MSSSILVVISLHTFLGILCKDDEKSLISALQASNSAECRYEFDELPQSRVVYRLMEQLRANNYEAMDAYVFPGFSAQEMTINPKTCKSFSLARNDDEVDTAKHMVVRRLLRWLSKVHRRLLHRKPRMCGTSSMSEEKRPNKTRLCELQNVVACMRQRVWDEKTQNFYVKRRLGTGSKSECYIGTGLLTITLLYELQLFAQNNDNSTNYLNKKRAEKTNEYLKDLFTFLIPELSDCLPVDRAEQRVYMRTFVEQGFAAIVNLKYHYHVKHFVMNTEHPFSQSTVEAGIPTNVLQCIDDNNNPKGTAVFYDIVTKFKDGCVRGKLIVTQARIRLLALKQKIAMDPRDLSKEISLLNLECVQWAHMVHKFVDSVGITMRLFLNADSRNDPTSAMIDAMSNVGALHLCQQSILFKYLETLHSIAKDYLDETGKAEAVANHFLNIYVLDVSSDDPVAVEEFKHQLLLKYDAEKVNVYFEQLRRRFICLRDKTPCSPENGGHDQENSGEILQVTKEDAHTAERGIRLDISRPSEAVQEHRDSQPYSREPSSSEVTILDHGRDPPTVDSPKLPNPRLSSLRTYSDKNQVLTPLFSMPPRPPSPPNPAINVGSYSDTLHPTHPLPSHQPLTSRQSASDVYYVRKPLRSAQDVPPAAVEENGADVSSPTDLLSASHSSAPLRPAVDSLDNDRRQTIDSTNQNLDQSSLLRGSHQYAVNTPPSSPPHTRTAGSSSHNQPPHPHSSLSSSPQSLTSLGDNYHTSRPLRPAQPSPSYSPSLSPVLQTLQNPSSILPPLTDKPQRKRRYGLAYHTNEELREREANVRHLMRFQN